MQTHGSAMDEMLDKVLALARGMWRRRWIGVLAGWAVGIAGAYFVMGYPDRYQASARLYVDTKTVLRPLMYGAVVELNTDQMAWMLSRTLITRPNMERLAQNLKLDADAKDQATRENLYLSVMKRVRIASLGRDGIYEFSFIDVNPERARVVVQGLVSMFVDADLQSKQRDSKLVRQFLDDQVKEYEGKLADADNRLKEFKLRNLSNASGRDYFNRTMAVEDEFNKLTVELRAAEESRDALKRELTDDPVTLTPDPSSPEGSVSPEFDTRLDAQRKQLDELLRRYTDLHPDVIATRRLVERLEEQKAAEVEAKKRAQRGKRPVSPQLEAAQRGKLALAEAEAQVASLRFRAGDAQARLSQLRGAASRVPQVEAEYAQLNRDYENARRNYDGMVSRRDKAILSDDVEANRAEQFRLIDPPRAANEPIFPSRRALAPTVVALALLAGAVVAALFELVFPTFDSAKLLRSRTSRPVLGSVSMLVTPALQRRSRQMTIAFCGSIATLLIVGLVWMKWLNLTSLQV